MKDFSIRFNYNLVTDLFGTTGYYILRGDRGERIHLIASILDEFSEDPSRK
jgi:hypothetical protein